MVQIVKNLPAKAGDARDDLWVSNIPGEGNGNPFQYLLLGKVHGQKLQRVKHDWARVCTCTRTHTHTHTHTELIRSTVDRTQKYLDFFNPKLPGLSNWWGFASTREWLWRIFSCVPFSLAQYTYPQFYTYLQFFNMAINIFLTYWYKVYKRTSKLPHFNPHYNFATPYPLNDNWGENSLKSISC